MHDMLRFKRKIEPQMFYSYPCGAIPFEQKFKQTERNSGGNSFRLNRQTTSRKIFAKKTNSGYPPVTGCWLWSHNEQNKLNWELIPTK